MTPKSKFTVRAKQTERERLFPRTKHVLDAQGAGSPQATRKRRLAVDCCGCVPCCLLGQALTSSRVRHESADSCFSERRSAMSSPSWIRWVRAASVAARAAVRLCSCNPSEAYRTGCMHDMSCSLSDAEGISTPGRRSERSRFLHVARYASAFLYCAMLSLESYSVARRWKLLTQCLVR